MRVTVNGKNYEVESGAETLTIDGREYKIRVVPKGDIRMVYIDTFEFPFEVNISDEMEGDATVVSVNGQRATVAMSGRIRAAAPTKRAAPSAAPKRSGPVPEGAIVAAMAGRIVTVKVEAGQAVKAGDVLLVLEAMKMENEITAPKDGSIKSVDVAPGARVNEGDVLVQLG